MNVARLMSNSFRIRGFRMEFCSLNWLDFASNVALVVRLDWFESNAVVRADYKQNTWKLLKTSIEHIHNKNASGLSFEELYRLAFFWLWVFGCCRRRRLVCESMIWIDIAVTFALFVVVSSSSRRFVATSYDDVIANDVFPMFFPNF